MARAMLQAWAIALAIVVAGGTWSAPADAQLSGSHAAFDARPSVQLVQFREFYQFPYGGDRGYYRRYYPENPWTPFYRSRPPQRVEATKPPPPRKAETPPSSTILVIGDLFADWLGYGLEDAFADTSEIGIVRKVRPYSGLVRYEARADTPEWSQAVKDVLAAEKPSAIVVMLGINDRLPLHERVPVHSSTPSSSSAAPATHPGTETAATKPSAEEPRTEVHSYEFHTEQWAQLYGKRIDEMIAALKTKGVPVLWAGLPAIKGTKSTSDMSYLDELYRAHAEKAGITYVDVWDGFVDEKGQFALHGPDFEGQTRRLRTFDGVYFTKAGADKLALYVEHELRRVLANHAVPVALPASEQPAKEGTTGARPAIGPVVPLNAESGAAAGEELLGASSSHPAQRETDPIAAHVLSRGDPIAAPPGRADDFSWPRADAKSDGAVDTFAPASPAASAPPAKAATKDEAGKGNTKKPAEAKVAPHVTLRSHRTGAALDRAPRPPLPIAPSGANGH